MLIYMYFFPAETVTNSNSTKEFNTEINEAVLNFYQAKNQIIRYTKMVGLVSISIDKILSF